MRLAPAAIRVSEAGTSQICFISPTEGKHATTPHLGTCHGQASKREGVWNPLSRTCDLFSSRCPCPCAEAITVPALRAQCLPVPHRNCSYLPAPLFPRALAEGQAMPPRMAVLSTSVCLTVGPPGQRHGRCRRGRTPTCSPCGELWQPRKKEGGQPQLHGSPCPK